jgi:hypothetical protein
LENGYYPSMKTSLWAFLFSALLRASAEGQKASYPTATNSLATNNARKPSAKEFLLNPTTNTPATSSARESRFDFVPVPSSANALETNGRPDISVTKEEVARYMQSAEVLNA